LDLIQNRNANWSACSFTNHSISFDGSTVYASGAGNCQIGLTVNLHLVDEGAAGLYRLGVCEDNHIKYCYYVVRVYCWRIGVQIYRRIGGSNNYSIAAKCAIIEETVAKR
jgi:hypothetical protein